MDIHKLHAFVGRSASGDSRFAKLAPLIEEYAEDIEAAIDEADLDGDEPISPLKLTLLRTALGEIDPDLADALGEELGRGLTSDQAQTLAAQLTVSCAMADQDRVAHVFSELARSYSIDDSDEIEIPDDSEYDDEIEPE